MERLERSHTPETSLTQDVIYAVRYYLGGRRGMIVLAVVVVGASLALSWGWLVAIGVAPLLLALAPCAAMCALGLCMNKGAGKSCSTAPEPTDPTGTPAGACPSITDGPVAGAVRPAGHAASHPQTSAPTVTIGLNHLEPQDDRRH